MLLADINEVIKASPAIQIQNRITCSAYAYLGHNFAKLR